jgi:hypothetical protein
VSRTRASSADRIGSKPDKHAIPDDFKSLPDMCNANLTQHQNGGHYLDLVLCCVYYSFPFGADKSNGYYASLYRLVDTTPDSGWTVVEFDERATYTD